MPRSVVQAAVVSPANLLARGRRLEYLTIAWNTFEAVVALASGMMAGSVALVGFGLDSVMETASAAVVLWRFRGTEHRERTARRLVGICFLLLAAYVASRVAAHAVDAGAAGTQCAGHSHRCRRHYRDASAGTRQAPRGRPAQQPSAAFRFPPGRLLRVPVGDPACRVGAAYCVRMVVGRSGRSAGHGADHHTRGSAGNARRGLRLRLGLRVG